jgi:hypothetical protein
MAKKPSEKSTQHVWRITELRKKGHYLGSVTAVSADAAIARAIEEFEITDPQRQKRLAAQREA